MKKINKGKVFSLVTNFALMGVITLVFTLGFAYNSSNVVNMKKSVQPIYRGNVEKRQVSIMFNVYENTEVVNSIIDVLEEYGVNATFFVGGCWADDNVETLKRIINSGSEIGNHGYFHKDHKKMSYEENLNEINVNTELIKGVCGVEMKLFAPPSGSFSQKTLDASDDLGYKVIMWSKDTIDWRDNDTKVIIDRATKNLKNGDLILMHPKMHTFTALPSILSYILHDGFNIVTVSENII